jgi:hypothetical protein
MLDFGQDAQLAFADPVDLVALFYGELRFPEVVSVSAAARRHRVLNNPGAYSGPWGEGPHFTAHLDRPMDCLAKESPYREVGVMGPSQVAKSEIGNNWQLHTVVYDPADLLFIGPDRVLIEGYVKKEFDKMVELARDDAGRAVLLDRMLPGASSDTLSLKRFRGAEFFFYWPTGGRLRALPFSRIRIDDLDEISTDISDRRVRPDHALREQLAEAGTARRDRGVRCRGYGRAAVGRLPDVRRALRALRRPARFRPPRHAARRGRVGRGGLPGLRWCAPATRQAGAAARLSLGRQG